MAAIGRAYDGGPLALLILKLTMPAGIP